MSSDFNNNTSMHRRRERSDFYVSGAGGSQITDRPSITGARENKKGLDPSVSQLVKGTETESGTLYSVFVTSSIVCDPSEMTSHLNQQVAWL